MWVSIRVFAFVLGSVSAIQLIARLFVLVCSCLCALCRQNSIIVLGMASGRSTRLGRTVWTTRVSVGGRPLSGAYLSCLFCVVSGAVENCWVVLVNRVLAAMALVSAVLWVVMVLLDLGGVGTISLDSSIRATTGALTLVCTVRLTLALSIPIAGMTCRCIILC